MSNKKNSKKQNKNNINNVTNLPFANEIKLLKDQFKKMVDDMPDEEFIEMVQYLMFSEMTIEDEWNMDEGWEDEAEEFYNKGNKNYNNLRLLKEDDDNLLF